MGALQGPRRRVQARGRCRDHRHPRLRDRSGRHGLWHAHRPVHRLRQRRHPVHAGRRALLQRHPELPRLRQPRRHHRQHGHPGRKPRTDHRPHRRRPPGLQRLGAGRLHPSGGSQPQADRHRQVPADRLVAVLVRQSLAVGCRHHGRPLPGARAVERVRQLHEPDEHHPRLGGPPVAGLLRRPQPVAHAAERHRRHHPAGCALDRAQLAARVAGFRRRDGRHGQVRAAARGGQVRPRDRHGPRPPHELAVDQRARQRVARYRLAAGRLHQAAHR